MNSNPRIGTWAEWLFLLAVLSMAVSPQYIFQDTLILGLELTTVHNLLVLVACTPYLLLAGLRQWISPLLIAYSVIVIMTFTLASFYPDMSALQPFKSFFALLLAPTLMQARFSGIMRHWLLRIIAFLSVISFFVGGILDILGLWDLFFLTEFPSQVLRLTTANAWFETGTLGWVTVVASVALIGKMRGAWVLALVNVVIVAWSGTRTAYPLALLSFLPMVWAWWTHYRQHNDRAALRKIALLGAVLTVIYASYLPFFILRTTPTVRTSPSVLAINDSGRFEAWRITIERASENWVFGRGLGTGTLFTTDAIRTPHNDYLRVLVDGGFAGLALALVAYALTFFRQYQQTSASLRLTVSCMVLGYAFVAIFANPLSVQQLAIPFWVLLGVFAQIPPEESLSYA